MDGRQGVATPRDFPWVKGDWLRRQAGHMNLSRWNGLKSKAAGLNAAGEPGIAFLSYTQRRAANHTRQSPGDTVSLCCIQGHLLRAARDARTHSVAHKRHSRPINALSHAGNPPSSVRLSCKYLGPREVESFRVRGKLLCATRGTPRPRSCLCRWGLQSADGRPPRLRREIFRG
jgi:hypothetical protein